MTFLNFSNVPLCFRGCVSATGSLCRCGSRTLLQDRRYRWRCERGHFARLKVRVS